MDSLELTPEVIKLIHLAYIKNELNKKRRRFYALIDDPSPEWSEIGKKGYECMKKEMKKLTPEMRKLRRLTGTHIMWGGSGNIIRIGKAIKKTHLRYGVYHDYAGKAVEARDFKRVHQMYLVDNILLKE